MSWFTRSRDGLRYRGRISYAPFAEWIATPEGTGVLTSLAKAIRFAPLGRMRSARRQLWRALAATARSDSVAAALQAEADRYVALMAEIAYTDGLPCVSVERQRLVVVPRSLLNGVMKGRSETRWMAVDVVPWLGAGSPLHAFFCRQLVRELDQAVLSWRATPRRVLPTPQHWVSVGHETAFAWTVSIGSEPAARGHHYMFEIPHRGVGWRLRRAIRTRMSELDHSISLLTREERQDILRRAWTPFLPRAA
jgi:hypothetical protein